MKFMMRLIVLWRQIKIETYWNVNTIESSDATSAQYIKIETYWNVNGKMTRDEIMKISLKQRHIGM